MESRFVNGVKVYAPASRQELINHAFAHGSILVAVNAEKILNATDQTRRLINENIGYPDGVGAILGLRRKGQTKTVKIPGCELWLDIIRANHQDKTFYLVGGRDSVIEATVKRLRDDFPGMRILAFRNGYLGSEEEKMAVISDVADKKPDVVFVAMGSPKQELLMEEMRRKHVAVYQGLGGSFDVYTGQVRRAPSWWVEHHLEWLYRLLQEPARIARQVHLLRFLVALYANKF